jgi:hypothetical protein
MHTREARVGTKQGALQPTVIDPFLPVANGGYAVRYLVALVIKRRRLA